METLKSLGKEKFKQKWLAAGDREMVTDSIMKKRVCGRWELHNFGKVEPDQDKTLSGWFNIFIDGYCGNLDAYVM
jgi:hypothetical protein